MLLGCNSIAYYSDTMPPLGPSVYYYSDSGLPFLDPHHVPLGLSPLNKPSPSYEILIEGMTPNPSYISSSARNTVNAFSINSNNISVNLDLSKMIELRGFGKGVYTISFGGTVFTQNGAYQFICCNYSFFVN
jgi:hypothetical protein